MVPPSRETKRPDPGPPLRVEKDNRRWLRWHEAGMRERRGRDFAMIFQNPRTALHPYFTVGQQLVETIRTLEQFWFQVVTLPPRI